MATILKNSVQCLKCGDIIVSMHRHDFKFCSCEAVGVDGGNAYLKRMGSFHHIKELSVMVEGGVEVWDTEELDNG
jgi:hypothetical protein